MASACVNNNISSFTWLNPNHSPDNLPHLDASAADFEFCLEHPVTMLPADELFSDGKLLPLHLSSLKPFTPSTTDSPSPETSTAKPLEPFLFSPKAPSCSSRWRELLGLKKKQQHPNNTISDTQKTTSSSSTKSIKQFLHHCSSKTTSSSENSTLNLPLLKDSDSESISLSSRLSLSSSSSSGHDHEDLPRLSLDSDKPDPNPIHISLHRNPNAHPRMRFVKNRTRSMDKTNNPNPTQKVESGVVESRGVSVDSPRMNSSGKIVFQSLERSSSSPSSLNGGPRFKHRGMERSYSSNVRVTPVLNVSVCSLMGSSKSGSVFGLGPFFSSSVQQKKEGGGGGSGSNRHLCNRN
ncbi:PREDICTED: uncharacterized protein LOC109352461 isoform X3 [Lupinus angustifolius]|uniref:uncharacterized protein LOC109352461 isoform X3 n=1 Tax=Lupinus angustifolius TaxID=3871 RepID=UPI00092F81B3|nr:PREDICTED: uncharacterized protein LOC109352461 isoform X3 [Lupinus angustifolius]